MIGDYFRKMAGTTQSPPRVGLAEITWSWLGAFLGIALVAYLDDSWWNKPTWSCSSVPWAPQRC